MARVWPSASSVPVVDGEWASAPPDHYEQSAGDHDVSGEDFKIRVANRCARHMPIVLHQDSGHGGEAEKKHRAVVKLSRSESSPRTIMIAASKSSNPGTVASFVTFVSQALARM
jgi:hypothetical protein